MPVSLQYHTDLSVIVASLCGAQVWVMTQRYFDRRKQPVVFLISFIMGVAGADISLEIIKIIMPGILSDERAIGAFFLQCINYHTDNQLDSPGEFNSEKKQCK